MATSIGTAWIQIKPSLAGVSKEIKSALDDSSQSLGPSFGNNFKSKFLGSARESFRQAFTELASRADAAFSHFRTVAKAGFAAASVGVVALGAQLDRATGAQSSFISNMKLAGRTNEEAAQTFKLLKEYANKSIYSLSDMTSTAGVLASTGVKNAGELVRAFGNLAAAAADPAQAIRSISQQMSQVNGKGFIQTMDWRIMAEQAAGPMKLVQDRLMQLNRWSSADFQKALSKGAISASMLNDAMLEVSKNGVLEELAIKPRTISDAWQALTSTFVSNLAESKTWNDAQQKIIDLLQQAGSWLDKNQDSIAQWISSMIDAGKKLASWASENKDLVLTIGKAVVAFKALQIATGGVRSAMDTLRPYNNIVKGVFRVFKKDENGVSQFSSFLKSDFVQSTSRAVSSAVTSAITVSGAWIASATSTAAAWIAANAAMLGLWGLAIGAVVGAVALIIANWSGITEFFGGVWGGIVGVFSAAPGFFSSVFSSAWEAVKGVFSGVGGFFRQVWNDIVSVFGSVGTAVGNAIGGAVKGVVNSILGFAENTINGFIRAINHAIGAINKIPGVNIGRLNTLNIPRLATGGPVFGGGGPMSDKVPAMLSNGEYVIRAAAARKIGYNRLHDINRSGEVGGSTIHQVFNINGYDKDPRQLADEISRIIALRAKGVVG